MTNFARPDALKGLYDSTYSWVVSNGTPTPAGGVESQLGPGGLPINVISAKHIVELTEAELSSIAPIEAEILKGQDVEGGLNIVAYEQRHYRDGDGILGYSPEIVVFEVDHDRPEGRTQVSYRISDPRSSHADAYGPTTQRFLRAMDWQWALVNGDLDAVLAFTPEQYTPGIDDLHRHALQNVVAALKVHWPRIIAARRALDN